MYDSTACSRQHPSKGKPGARTGVIDLHVGGRVRMLRQMRGKSQQWLAHRLGLTPQMVQKYEKGKSRVAASRLYEIGCVLNAPAQFFYEGRSDPEIAMSNARREALEQLREPTDAMVDAGRAATAIWLDLPVRGVELEREKFRIRWRAMIDRAIADINCSTSEKSEPA